MAVQMGVVLITCAWTAVTSGVKSYHSSGKADPTMNAEHQEYLQHFARAIVDPSDFESEQAHAKFRDWVFGQLKSAYKLGQLAMQERAAQAVDDLDDPQQVDNVVRVIRALAVEE